jgi:glycosyltransferase involved in cell wall biosynthesis
MKKVLVISFSDLNYDGRVSRQIDFIKKKYAVTVICYQGISNNGYNIVRVEKTRFTLFHKLVTGIYLLLKLYQKAYSLLYQFKSVLTFLEKENFDLIIANDVEGLPLAFLLKKKSKIIFDAHEYAPRHFEDKLVWRIFFQPFNAYLCKKYIPLVDRMTTVSRGLAEEYHKNFNVMPELITNATWSKNLVPSATLQNKIRMVHQGGAIPSRKLELMIEMMGHLDDRFTLDLILMAPQLGSARTNNYIDNLTELAQKDSRIRILPPLKSKEVVEFINQYDIGIFLLPPINFNYANTLPNKLFDFIQARLAIAIGPTPEMAEVVKEYKLGVIANDFTAQSLAEKLNAITSNELRAYKINSDLAASNLCAEKNERKFNNLISEVLS